MLIEGVLADEHFVVVGPFDRAPAALATARTEALMAWRIPFLLLSGYGANAVPSGRPNVRT